MVTRIGYTLYVVTEYYLNWISECCFPTNTTNPATAGTLIIHEGHTSHTQNLYNWQSEESDKVTYYILLE